MTFPATIGEGDKPLNHPMEETIIYEAHVRGFTQSSTSGVRSPGTFAGLVEKIPYLRDLGITAVELLPIFDFDTSEARVLDGQLLRDFWGYSTVGYFALQSSYCCEPESGGQLREFRDMVKAMHKAGIEVILDVVFNHTDEGNHRAVYSKSAHELLADDGKTPSDSAAALSSFSQAVNRYATTSGNKEQQAGK